MRKKVLRAALMAAVVAVAGYGVYTNQTKGQTLSDIILENAEALAYEESGIGGKYQTMGYCTPFRLDLKCQYTPTSTPCTNDCD